MSPPDRLVLVGVGRSLAVLEGDVRRCVIPSPPASLADAHAPPGAITLERVSAPVVTRAHNLDQGSIRIESRMAWSSRTSSSDVAERYWVRNTWRCPSTSTMYTLAMPSGRSTKYLSAGGLYQT